MMNSLQNTKFPTYHTKYRKWYKYWYFNDDISLFWSLYNQSATNNFLGIPWQWIWFKILKHCDKGENSHEISLKENCKYLLIIIYFYILSQYSNKLIFLLKKYITNIKLTILVVMRFLFKTSNNYLIVPLLSLKLIK